MKISDSIWNALQWDTGFTAGPIDLAAPFEHYVPQSYMILREDRDMYEADIFPDVRPIRSDGFPLMVEGDL